MKYPATCDQLTAAGFKFNRTAPCRGATCDEQIFWYVTPGGHPIPMARFHPDTATFEFGDKVGAPTLYQPHFANCPDVKDFRKGKK